MSIDPKDVLGIGPFKLPLEVFDRHKRFSGNSLTSKSAMISLLQEYFPHHECHCFSDLESHDRPVELQNISGDVGVREYIIDDDLRVIHLFLDTAAPKTIEKCEETPDELKHGKTWADLKEMYPDHKFRVLYMYTGRELYDPIITGTFDRFSYNTSEVMKTVYVFLDEDILSKNEAFLSGTWDDLAELKR